MDDITQDQLRGMILLYIRKNYKTQIAFAAAVGYSVGHVSRVLTGKESVPSEWLEFVGATAEVRCEDEAQPENNNFMSFRIERENGFHGMPLARVAQYMTELAKLAGPYAVFSGMTDCEIRFSDPEVGA